MVYPSRHSRLPVLSGALCALSLALWSAGASAGAMLDASASATLRVTSNPSNLAVEIFDTTPLQSSSTFGNASAAASATSNPFVDGSIDPPVPLPSSGLLTTAAFSADADATEVAPLAWGLGSATVAGILLIDNTSGPDTTLSFTFDWLWNASAVGIGIDEWATVDMMLSLFIGNADPDANPDDPANTLLDETLFSVAFDTRLGQTGGANTGMLTISDLAIATGLWAMLVDLQVINAQAESNWRAAPVPGSVWLLGLGALPLLARRRRRGPART